MWLCQNFRISTRLELNFWIARKVSTNESMKRLRALAVCFKAHSPERRETARNPPGYIDLLSAEGP